MIYIENYSELKSEQELADGVRKCFDWALKHYSSSGRELAKLIFWLYYPQNYPNNTGIYNLDNTRREWALDLIMYSLMYGEPHDVLPPHDCDAILEKLKEMHLKNSID